MPGPSTDDRRFTVAHVRECNDCAEIMFIESARIYRLPRTHPAYGQILELFRQRATGRCPVTVRIGGADGETIEAASD